MNTISSSVKNTIVGILLIALFSMSFAPLANAQVLNQNYQPRTVEELIAYLQGIIAQLQAQLALQRGQTVQTTATVSTYGFGNQYQYGRGQVLGTQTSYDNSYNYTDTSSYDLKQTYRSTVSRPSVFNIDDEKATFETTISFNGAPYVEVWFTYGPSGYMANNTQKERVYSNNNYTRTYRKEVSDLEGSSYDVTIVQANIEEPNGTTYRSQLRTFETDESDRNNDDDEPDVNTNRASNIEETEAVLEGDVDMNDFNNGIVFFVYGVDEDLVDEIEDDYNTYSEIDEEGDDLQKVRIDSDLDGDENYRLRVTNLDDDTEFFFQICVEFENEDNDEKIICGGVEDFETDR